MVLQTIAHADMRKSQRAAPSSATPIFAAISPRWLVFVPERRT